MYSKEPHFIQQHQKELPPDLIKPMDWVNRYMETPISKAAGEYLNREAFYLEAPKGKLLLKEGQRFPYLLAIIKGVVRSFVHEDHTEITVWFAAENYLVTDPQTLFENSPSSFNIQCLEDCNFIGIHKDKLDKWNLNYEDSNLAGRRLLQHLFELEREHTLLARLSQARNRYAKFLELMPQLENRIPQKYIASYLNMTTETLSRLKSAVREEQ